MTLLIHGSSSATQYELFNAALDPLCFYERAKMVGSLQQELQRLNQQHPTLSVEELSRDNYLIDRIIELLDSRAFCWRFTNKTLTSIPHDTEEPVKDVLSSQGKAILKDLDSLLTTPGKFHKSTPAAPYGFTHLYRIMVSVKLQEWDATLKTLAAKTEEACRTRRLPLSSLRKELQQLRNDFQLWKNHQFEFLVSPPFSVATDKPAILSFETSLTQLLKEKLGWNQNFGSDPSIHPLGSFLHHLQTIIDSEKNSALTTAEVAALNKLFIAALPNDSLAASIDATVHALAPEPKAGPTWGADHRYDDLARLKQAILLATFENFNSWLEKDSELVDDVNAQQMFYTTLSGRAKAENITNAKEWAKRNLAYYLPQISPVLEHTYKSRIPLPLTGLMDDVPLPSTESVLLNDEPVSLDPSTTNKLLGTAAQEIAFTQRTIDALGKTKGLMPSNQRIMIEKLKEQVRATVEQLPEKERNNIFKRVWDLSTATRTTGDPQWGQNHCTDDLAILLQATNEEIKGLR